jgi:hypothetical protein
MAETVNVPPRGRRPDREETPPKNRSRAKDSEPDAQDAASRRERNTGTGAAERSRPSPNTKAGRADAQIKESLVNLYGTVGLAVNGVGTINQNPAMVAAGVNIVVQAPTLADTWLEVGTQVPTVRRFLESMLVGSAVATIAMQHVGIVAPVLWALGLIPGAMGEAFLTPDARIAGEAFAAAQTAATAQTNGTPPTA